MKKYGVFYILRLGKFDINIMGLWNHLIDQI